LQRKQESAFTGSSDNMLVRDDYWNVLVAISVKAVEEARTRAHASTGKVTLDSYCAVGKLLCWT
jgi:tRNA(Phe) wybutosine-synthesizing methylase Tyw3